MDWKSTVWIVVGLAVRLGWGLGRMRKERWTRQTNTPHRKDVLSHTEYILIKVHRGEYNWETCWWPPCGLLSFLFFYEVREGIVTSVLWHFEGNLPFYITNHMWFWNFFNFYFIWECNLQCCVSFRYTTESNMTGTTAHTHHIPVFLKSKSESVSRSVVSTLCDPMDCSPPGSSVHGIL